MPGCNWYDASKVPLIYLQEHGLFMFIQAFAYAYVAERPSKSIPVVALATLVNGLRVASHLERDEPRR